MDNDVYAEEAVIKLKGRKSISTRKGNGKANDDWDSGKSGSDTGAALIQDGDDEIEQFLPDPTPNHVLPSTKWRLSISRATQVGKRWSDFDMQMITLGGNTELELVDSMDPFSEGIIFSVMPPKKSRKNISNLSGSEKALSSLALVFALHVFKPIDLPEAPRYQPIQPFFMPTA
ncbi:hypothetical protein PILCRDRAFT_12772 [Piloderma croceum F 1598]|uniref:RecF/RecN/SMC N-terminal domain-containing protein n=1 Tax=Piloderma croceum (strain F 1598) TaxID=765440 RepID=A0A0C3BGS7_PILCF|nr:hypothetical protein PILCRDRAFT_12772 [Piloderma croceum F 1598]